MQAYMAAMRGLADRLLPLIAKALNLPTDFFDMYFDKPMVSLRPLHYSPQVSDPDKARCYLPLGSMQCLELPLGFLLTVFAG